MRHPLAWSAVSMDVLRWLVKKSMASVSSPLNDRSSTVELRREPFPGSFRSSSCASIDWTHVASSSGLAETVERNDSFVSSDVLMPCSPAASSRATICRGLVESWSRIGRKVVEKRETRSPEHGSIKGGKTISSLADQRSTTFRPLFDHLSTTPPPLLRLPPGSLARSRSAGAWPTQSPYDGVGRPVRARDARAQSQGRKGHALYMLCAAWRENHAGASH